MTRFRFARLLALRGPHIALWPEAERVPALRLLRRSGAMRRRLLIAIENDPVVAAETAAVDPVIASRLLAAIRRAIPGTAPRAVRIRPGGAPLPAIRWGALAACALLGVWVGWTADVSGPPATVLASLQLTPMMDPAP